MGPRHLIMIAMGGVIGSGLFLSSGYTIEQAARSAPSWPTWLGPLLFTW